MNRRFYVFPRVRRNEFRFGVCNSAGRELGNIGDEGSALRIVSIMNANDLSPERVAKVTEKTTRERLRQVHLLAVLRARRHAGVRA